MENSVKHYYLTILIVLFSVCLFSCDGGPKRTGRASDLGTINGLTASATNGKIYFATNCSRCHAAGNDDTVSAFGDKSKMDLKAKHAKIQSNMSDYDSTNLLMGRFTNIPNQRVIDLQAYLSDPKL